MELEGRARTAAEKSEVDTDVHTSKEGWDESEQVLVCVRSVKLLSG